MHEARQRAQRAERAARGARSVGRRRRLLRLCGAERGLAVTNPFRDLSLWVNFWCFASCLVRGGFYIYFRDFAFSQVLQGTILFNIICGYISWHIHTRHCRFGSHHLTNFLSHARLSFYFSLFTFLRFCSAFTVAILHNVECGYVWIR